MPDPTMKTGALSNGRIQTRGGGGARLCSRGRAHGREAQRENDPSMKRSAVARIDEAR